MQIRWVRKDGEARVGDYQTYQLPALIGYYYEEYEEYWLEIELDA